MENYSTWMVLNYVALFAKRRCVPFLSASVSPLSQRPWRSLYVVPMKGSWTPQMGNAAGPRGTSAGRGISRAHTSSMTWCWWHGMPYKIYQFIWCAGPCSHEKLHDSVVISFQWEFHLLLVCCALILYKYHQVPTYFVFVGWSLPWKTRRIQKANLGIRTCNWSGVKASSSKSKAPVSSIWAPILTQGPSLLRLSTG